MWKSYRGHFLFLSMVLSLPVLIFVILMFTLCVCMLTCVLGSVQLSLSKLETGHKPDEPVPFSRWPMTAQRRVRGARKRKNKKATVITRSARPSSRNDCDLLHPSHGVEGASGEWGQSQDLPCAPLRNTLVACVCVWACLSVSRPSMACVKE